MAATTTSARRTRKTKTQNISGPGGPWHASAPRHVRKAFAGEHPQRGWEAWSEYLAERRLPTLSKPLPGKSPPLTWGLEHVECAVAAELLDAVSRLGKSRRGKNSDFESRAIGWLQASEAHEVNVSSALVGLCWCQALPLLAAMQSAETWWRVLNRLVEMAAKDDAESDEPLTRQLLHGELPLTLAYTFPELESCRALAATGRAAVLADAPELIDEAGLPTNQQLQLMRPLLASWTRCRALDPKLNDRWAGSPAQGQYRCLVQQVLRWSRPSGEQIFTPAGSVALQGGLLKAALRFAEDPETSAMFRVIQRGSAKKLRDKHAVQPAFESEQAGIAVLRPDWNSSAPRLHVRYDGPRVSMELNNGPRCLWSGEWDFEVRLNGELLHPRGSWDQTCWMSDKEVDYLELGLQLSQEVTLERHVLLARKDRLLFLADAVLGIQQGIIEYRGSLPLAGWSTFEVQRETREGSLTVKEKPVARVLPLALPEWRSARSRGNLQAEQGGLILTQSAEGQCLFAPLLIDLDRKRMKKDVTWRQLTVAQDRAIVARDVAVGFRAQAGKSQWLVYRSLAQPDIRSLLGKSLLTEFLLGEFQADGKVETLLEIE